MDTLTTRGRAARLLATGLGAVLLLAGTVRGQDDHFPFGPFLMFAGSNPPNEPAPDTRVEGRDRTGALVMLDERSTGIRRAEIEGRQSRYAADPALLREVAEAYVERHPGAADVVDVRLVVRWHKIRAGRPTGQYTDEIVAQWRTR
jgi:hypothetical protein